MSIFQLKYFSIKQDINTMKVGTDSFVLAAFFKNGYKKGLDIGSGTGILSLLLTQINQEINVTSIEIDKFSAEEGRVNGKNSPFNKRLQFINGDFLTFPFETKFDYIISNPPYFFDDLLSPEDNKNRVRHNNSLPINLMIKRVSELLDENGVFQCIIPFNLLNMWLIEAEKVNLFLIEKINVYSKIGKIKRYILIFSKSKNKNIIENDFIIRDENNNFSKQYKSSTKEFHSKEL